MGMNKTPMPTRHVRLTQTHTFVELELSAAAYAEIETKLREAGYHHAFMDGGAIDMHGLAVAREETGVAETLTSQTVVDWAVSRWAAEVKLRPLQNVHRRSLDDTWRQVIRQFGGNDKMLCGPAHGELVNAVPVPSRASPVCDDVGGGP